MGTDSKNKGLMPIGFNKLNFNTFANTFRHCQSGNNLHYGGYTVVVHKRKEYATIQIYCYKEYNLYC